MARQIPELLSSEWVDAVLALPDVLAAKGRIDAKAEGSESFSVALPSEVRTALQLEMGLDLSAVPSIPMRWIKGETVSHVDTGAGAFADTYLVYLTDSAGELIVDGQSYPIRKGVGYSFSEGLRHETVGTGSEPRLLLGPMNERGAAVGIFTIYRPGGSTVYLRETGTDVEYSDDLTTWNTFYWPCEIANTSPGDGRLRILFTTNITLTSANCYFLISSENIQFGSETLNEDGSRPQLTVENVLNYTGLFHNGSSGASGSNNIYIYNLIIGTSGTSSLAYGDGWFGHAYFGKGATGNYFVNCSATGDTPGDSLGTGAIVGAYAGSGFGAQLTIIGCSSSGSIGQLDGGILGGYAADNGGYVTCALCWSTGSIGGVGAGGIYGEYAGNGGTAIATRCYSTGTISNSAGGIFGRYAGANEGYALAGLCYSLGTIATDAGGIFSIGAGTSAGFPGANNCYSAGTLTTSGTGIYGSSKEAGTETNCYVANGSWNTTAANASLNGVPVAPYVVGDSWIATVVNQPYELNSMGYTPYTLTIVVPEDSSLLAAYSESVEAGASSSPAINPDASGNDFTILQVADGDAGSYATITINAQTGRISTTTSTVPGLYTIIVRSVGSYNISTFSLTVTAPAPDGAATVSCCDRTLDLKGADYVMRTQITAGNVMIGSTAPQRSPMSYADILAMKMAYACKR